MHNACIDTMDQNLIKAKKQATTNGRGVRVISGNSGENWRLQTNGPKA